MKIPGLSPSDLDYIRPYFLGDDAGDEAYRYVLWLDVMGAGAKMRKNLNRAAIPIMKLHVAALTALQKNTKGPIQLFPIIDGMYVVTEDFSSLAFFLSETLRSMAAEFITLKNWERTIVRGALSYGPILLGTSMTECSDILKQSNYCDAILLGMPLEQSYGAERRAPPFGVYVHESARAFAPTGVKPINSVWWQWWHKDKSAQKIAKALPKELKSYFKWCEEHAEEIGYPKERIKAHEELGREYLSDVEAIIAARQLKKSRNGKA